MSLTPYPKKRLQGESIGQTPYHKRRPLGNSIGLTPYHKRGPLGESIDQTPYYKRRPLEDRIGLTPYHKKRPLGDSIGLTSYYKRRLLGDNIGLMPYCKSLQSRRGMPLTLMPKIELQECDIRGIALLFCRDIVSSTMHYLCKRAAILWHYALHCSQDNEKSKAYSQQNKGKFFRAKQARYYLTEPKSDKKEL